VGIDHKSRGLDPAVAHVVPDTRPVVVDSRVNNEAKGADRARAENEIAPTVSEQDLKGAAEGATGMFECHVL